MIGEKHTALTYLMIIPLVLWGCVTGALFARMDTNETVLLAWALNVMIPLAFFARPFRGAGAVATAVAVVYFLGLQGYRMIVVAGLDPRTIHFPLSLASSPEEPNYLLLGILGLLCLIITGLLSDALARRLWRTTAQLERHAKLVEELTLLDGLTGTLKSVYADRLLTGELERSRRYNRSLSLLLIDMDNWPDKVRERGQEQAKETLKTIGQELMSRVRSVDTVSYQNESRFVIILPETQLEGARAVAERLCRSLSDKTSCRFRAGAVEFPSDAVSRRELLDEAEAALAFARTVGSTVASRSMLV